MSTPSVALAFEPLAAHHDVESFSSAKPVLDQWLKTRALANQRNRFSVTIVARLDAGLVGYYALAPTAVLPSSMTRSLRTGQPPNPIPCLLLGQLAVEKSMEGRGLGSALLADALRRAVKAADLVGGRALLVRALDEEAAGFWRRYGFQPSRDDSLTLMRSMPDIEASVRAAASA